MYSDSATFALEEDKIMYSSDSGTIVIYKMCYIKRNANVTKYKYKEEKTF